MERTKVIRVLWFPQNGSSVPGIRVAGKWLSKVGFEVGDYVRLTAREKTIVIEKINSPAKEGEK